MDYRSASILSLCSVEVSILPDIGERPLSKATAFFLKYKEELFLVTNQHVVTGRNVFDGNKLYESATVPGYLDFKFKFLLENNESYRATSFANPIKIPLYGLNDEGNDLNLKKPLFKLHPNNHNIDIAVMKITDHKNFKYVQRTMGFIDFGDTLSLKEKLTVMDEVFILGYPFRTSTTPNDFPIYKSATVATEPDYYEKLPIFYVDGKTKKGMSGSPVFAKSYTRINKNPAFPELHRPVVYFVGVYSGRDVLPKDLYTAELGIVWNIREALLPILNQF